MNILNLNCSHTNIYLLEAKGGWLMIDTDFPDTFCSFLRLLKQNELDASSIKYLIVTHFHPDHAGFAQDLKDLGIKLILHEVQIPYVSKLNDFFKKDKRFNYKDITTSDNIVVSSANSREIFKGIGIDGKLIQTPGHSEDSISLILDGICAFTGDLPNYEFIDAFDDETIRESWKLLQSCNVQAIYPAHGKSYSIS